MHYNRIVNFAFLIILSVLLASCSSDASIEPRVSLTNIENDDSVGSLDANEPQVFFTNMKDGDTVSSPVAFEWSFVNFSVEPYGNIIHGPVVHEEGAGQPHIMIYTPCKVAGEAIRNGSQFHNLLGQTAPELKLSPDEYTPCLQARDRAHTALSGEGMTVVFTTYVEE